MTYPFPLESFGFVAALATLHHLPLADALNRFGELVKPGGTVAIAGLYRMHSLADYAAAARQRHPAA